MKVNLTLAIDDELLRESRKLALDRNTTVNQMVRDYLESEVRQGSKKSMDGFHKIWRESKAEIGPVRWTRDDIYER